MRSNTWEPSDRPSRLDLAEGLTPASVLASSQPCEVPQLAHAWLVRAIRFGCTTRPPPDAPKPTCVHRSSSGHDSRIARVLGSSRSAAELVEAGRIVVKSRSTQAVLTHGECLDASTRSMSRELSRRTGGAAPRLGSGRRRPIDGVLQE